MKHLFNCSEFVESTSNLSAFINREDIAKIICGAIAKFGPVYYDFNDCDGIDFQLY